VVGSIDNCMRPLSKSHLLLFCGLSGVGCEALLGAEFGDYNSQRDEAGASSSDGSSTDRASADGDTQEDGQPEPPSEGGSVPPEAGGRSCIPGEIHDIAACSKCGRYQQSCNDQGSWNPPSCEGSGECVPGTTLQRPCEVDGTQTVTCDPNCTWMPGPCDKSDCMSTQVEKHPCGLCGTQSRTCQATDVGWKWTPFSMCMDQKDCAPTDTQRETCGKCGTRSRVCNMQCTWSSWESCQGEGECTPADTQERACLIGLLRQTRTCSERCAWGDWMGLCL
jgi:hypothetical protein